MHTSLEKVTRLIVESLSPAPNRNLTNCLRDIPGGRVVEPSPSKAVSVGSFPGQRAQEPTSLSAKEPKYKTGATL